MSTMVECFYRYHSVGFDEGQTHGSLDGQISLSW